MLCRVESLSSFSSFVSQSIYLSITRWFISIYLAQNQTCKVRWFYIFFRCYFHTLFLNHLKIYIFAIYADKSRTINWSPKIWKQQILQSCKRNNKTLIITSMLFGVTFIIYSSKLADKIYSFIIFWFCMTRIYVYVDHKILLQCTCTRLNLSSQVYSNYLWQIYVL